MLDVHLTAPFRLIQAATPHMRDAAKAEIERDGKAAPRSIINVSSTSGTHGNAGQVNYGTVWRCCYVAISNSLLHGSVLSTLTLILIVQHSFVLFLKCRPYFGCCNWSSLSTA